LPFLGVVLRRMTAEDAEHAALVDAELDRQEELAGNVLVRRIATAEASIPPLVTARRHLPSPGFGGRTIPSWLSGSAAADRPPPPGAGAQPARSGAPAMLAASLK